MGEAVRTSWQARLLQLVKGVPLDGADEERYQAERRERNRRNIRAATLALLPCHLLAALLYWPPGGPIANLPEFTATLCLVNLLVMPLAFGLMALVLWVEPRWWPGQWRSWASDLFALIYVLFATALSINAQRKNGNINVFTLAVLGTTQLLRQRAWATATVTLAGLAALVVGVLWVQPERDLRLMALTSAMTVAVLAFVLSRLNVATARSELAARLTVERQRAELAVSHDELGVLNRELERRVREQVDEIIVRATEIEKLNRHLRAQVIDRSRQLAQALKAFGPRPQAALSKGDTLDGRVEIQSLLASGAMGDVYRGEDRILARDVAVKVLRTDSGVSSDLWVRFAAEAEAAAAVHHPCVVHTLHVGITDDGRLYQLQELVDGVTLAATLAGGGVWSAHAAARIGERLADALAAAHGAGIVHRDVKPSNVMLTPTAPGVHLLDFGVSKTHRRADGSGPDGTSRTELVGTPLYMAPEQITAPDQVAAPCDVYALGAVLHELIAGTPPFSGGTAKLLDQHLHQPPPRLGEAQAPAAIADLVVSCLAKDPAARPTARALADQLRAIADAAGTPPAEALPRPSPDAKRAAATGDTVRQKSV